MKKIILFMVCLLAVATLGCGNSHYSNKKADDAISKAIYEELGGEEVYYEKREIDAKDIICYHYVFYKEQENQLSKMIMAANTAIAQAGIDDKICIMCFTPIPGGQASILIISNYDEWVQGKADYPALEKLRIWGIDDQYSIYNDPATYSGITGIKYLEVQGELAKITEQENIDWYEYFPDLETLEVITESD